MTEYLDKEEYEEPRCLLNMHPEITHIPIGRLIEKLDSYLDKNDYVSAERHLNYWLCEAEKSNDTTGKLTVLNEQIGLYRKLDKKDEGLEAIRSALSLIEKMNMDNTVTFGTTLINAATGYKAFGMAENALPLYEKAKKIYEEVLSSDDGRLGGLYNNMALTLAELGSYKEAEELYCSALSVTEKQENGELESAITYLNLADLKVAEKGFETAENDLKEYLEKAEKLLDAPTIPRNGYYAFVCQKCAPVFGYYGYFLTEAELNKRAEEIYERS